MQTAVRDAVIGSFEIEDPFAGSEPVGDDAVVPGPVGPFAGRLFTVRHGGRTAFEGSFETAYAWAVTRDAGPVTLTSFDAAAPAA